MHHKITNTHKKTTCSKSHTESAKKHAMIYVEDLQVENMSKSAKGTAEEHGKNVK
ncbi:TPA: hypothetical protein ACPJLN_000184 [Haemophilus influenzae]|uniref:hypothetical protein n=1 Tax=Haemophilus influenzae TaxID=727 RepID=UPI00014FD0C8|nr:hypothetical protein [Haemophilus influenzae]EEP47846.1 hypothetical protein CGSHi6P18H1_01026 [Haemophilus influenzae 6P18H1]AVI96441.1 hypothetical protein BV083_1407 [Haemophilus influenzae]AVI98213.1 hypothetical protein BV085_1404 [Haemophilus influenzae]AVJ03652.1 hypothetical protein BV131_1367 [Haemophilus influenzae]AVJ05394.1 hypothetical protein BV134_1368 [Haemophilus influenzae]